MCLYCQPVEISQTLLNLLNNAFDVIEKLEERWIRIQIDKKDDYLTMSVINSGPKIPDAVVEKIFQPFFTTKGVGKGTGLGLSISKNIIERHNGTLSVDNSCQNTKFDIRIPSSRIKPSAS
jgi:signal transduction histidine kinase